MKICVYSPISSNRLSYVVETLWFELTGDQGMLTYDLQAFLHHDGMKINYSNEPIENILSVRPQGLLSETSIRRFVWNDWSEEPLSEANMEWPYDIFSWIFYLVTRYEEFLPNKHDQHRRFQASESWMYRQGLHRKPIIDIQIKLFLEHLQKIQPEYTFSTSSYKEILTIDIDHIFKYRGKSALKLLLKAAKAIITFNTREMAALFQFLAYKKDPYDTYDLIAELTSRIDVYIFYLLSSRGGHDNNTLHKKHIQTIYKKLGKAKSQGLHPSYASNKHPHILKEEVDLFKKLFLTHPSTSRQHFLKLHLPDTYQQLLALGIHHDFTMGWADDIGFRAGTSHTYTWFDLSADKTTSLKITPFCVMDVTLSHYLKLSAEETKETLTQMKNELKKVGGQYISLWHNETMNKFSVSE